MKVLGVDPGYGRCGIAIIERIDGRDSLLYSTCVETNATQEFANRLGEIITLCRALILQHQPDSFAIEKLFFTKNKTTAMRVAEVRGALIQCATENGLALREYGPGEIKSAITSSGRADKTAMMKMIPLLIKIEKPIRYDDEYDAIAVALTHLAVTR